MKSDIILLVEDNPDDAELTIRALRHNRITNQIVHVVDGAEALDYLFATGAYLNRAPDQLPRLILLDLKLPKMDGLEVLRQVRAHPLTRLLPVVVLTTSSEEGDLLVAYENHSNSYIRKPVDFVQFTECVRLLGLYWLVVNESPPIQVSRPTTDASP